MGFFGAEVKCGQVSWIDASSECNVHLSNVCLFKRPKKQNARVVLEICEPQEDNDPPMRVALAVLSPSGIENINLNVLLTTRLGLSIAGDDIDGAVVHIVGKELVTTDEDSDMGDEDLRFAQQMVDLVFPDGGDDRHHDTNIHEDDSGDDDDDSDEEEDDQVRLETPFRRHDHENDRSKTEQRQRTEAERAGGGKLVVKPQPGKVRSGGLPIMTHRSGLKFQDILLGSGKRVKRGHNVALSYVLRLESGKVIDRADRKRPFRFRLGIGECVKGFDIGVMGMREGGERHLIVPPELGYGSQSPPGIPRNSTLYFDITVMKAF